MLNEPIDVAELRERLGWTQQKLAEHCDVDRSTISNWEAKPPTKGPAFILLRQLACSIQEAAE
ncbi:helix-turn-helix domain-containing protein [Chelativorans oligotrophicus]|uniref:helix-turn-helix domain-containing protein n=1 Tax=Chelativorans oligotrophicus TaxID=449974 RepID=UPI00140D54BE|nr:helix-turn-helix transcriptional regulator [Chelativorans oligotrophicus]